MELLELHRASAGSGKTYTLAKKFLWYYLTISENEDSERRLRTEPELRDSLSHILAVTFTNKATNEMKQRIVEKLNALAYPDKEYLNGDLTAEPDYMHDFLLILNGLPLTLAKEEYAKLPYSDDLDVTREKISSVARRALYILLENYSDFQVSTIDSFFQLVLRTFAYETDLNDSYALELDSNYLAKVSIDATLQDIEESRVGSEVKFWVNLLMETSRKAGRNHWNLFQKGDVTGSVYSNFITTLGRLENEEFKKIRDNLERYFAATPDLQEIYEALDKKIDTELKQRFRNMTDAAHSLLNHLNVYTGGASFIESMRSHALKSLGYYYDSLPDSRNRPFTPKSKDSFNGPTYQKILKSDPDYFTTAASLYLTMTAAYEEWKNAFVSGDTGYWLLYKKNFPYLGLLQIVLRKRREYLEDNNSVELGETNTLLRKIIGKDDTPFIYERLGTRLNHFLIDEFQDTSELQWENFKPLLQESLGRGNENLLIGDAKQSIYRFRNADSTLISRKVEEQFAEVELHGERPEENTNYRSSIEIVEFNNGFFRMLTDRLGNEMSDNGGTIDFRSLYSNVEQNVAPKYRDKERDGYVEADFIKVGSASAYEETVLQKLPDLINELRSRGYRMKDIAVLVKTNEQGEDIISALTRYNSEIDDASRRIEFISEQSLKVDGSGAVRLILNTLTAIAKGSDPDVRTGEEARKRGRADWTQMESNFRVFALRHPELSTPEQIQKFLDSGSDTDAISKMLGDMQAVTLPALVEGISATFIPEDIRRRDAAFIAAFQDLVLEYCESHPSDIASFLLWWQRRGAGASITSPEDMDAVKVMTVHKSKGLEFPCVIMPFAQAEFNVTGKKEEWRWVKPYDFKIPNIDLPPFVPVGTTSALENTIHEPLYTEYRDLLAMDALNTLYVGFTRAVNELYIFCIDKGKDKLSVSSLLRNYMGSFGDEDQLTLGNKYEKSPVKIKSAPYIIKNIEDYTARITPDFLRYKETEVVDIPGTDGEAEEEDPDPRSEGNLLHGVMERINTAADIDKAVRRMVRQGLISNDRVKEISEKISKWLQIPEVKEWFDGSARVITERSLLTSKGKMLRPDRLLVYPDGSAVVVDYKFGEHKNLDNYYRQVRRYVERLKDTGKFNSVKGYLWFVKLGIVEFVCD